MDLLKQLNPQQQRAVTAPQGQVLILAGPGSGKTRVLTHRLAHLIQSEAVPAQQIVALTFTNKAAREMQARAEQLLDGVQSGSVLRPRLGTFHAFFARLLRAETDRLPFDREFVIFDESDQLTLVREALKELNLDPKQHQPTRLLEAISLAKNQMLEPETVRNQSYVDEIVRRVYERYRELLLRNNAVDFDDLLLWPLKLLQAEPQLLAGYRRRYSHLLVDEFQDTNALQYSLLVSLAGDAPDLYVVADPDQSIYGWRGADARNVQRLQDDYPALDTLLLEQNYRSTQTILDAAMAVIDRLPDRRRKQLFTERGAGEPVLLHEAYDQDDEAQFVVDTISMLTLRGEADPGDCAVMYRTNAQSRSLEEAFFRAGLPYRLVGAQRFYGRREVKDLISYLRLIHNPADQVSLGRAINTPPRGIGEVTLNALRQAAAAAGTTPVQVLLRLAGGVEVGGLSGRAETALRGFGELLDGWIRAKDDLPVEQLIDRITSQIDYQTYLNAEDRWANVLELRAAAEEFSTLGLVEFLQQVALVSDQDTLTDDLNAPTLLTLHSAKGLEFPVVIIIGLDEGELPHHRSQNDPEAMAEERRLFYVGLTRAKDRVILVRAFRRRLFGVSSLTDPSRFLDDLPADLLQGDLIGLRSSEHASYTRQTSWEDRTPRLSEPRFQIGMRVLHPKFGEGIVLATELDRDEEEVTVNFEAAGVKRLAASLANLEIEE